MTERELIDDYLRSLSRHLSRLDRADADEVMREITSHVDDAFEAQAAARLPIDATQILAGFGSPRELADRYVEHVLQGSPPPPGFRAIQRVKKQTTRGLYWATAASGYGMALAMILVAVCKPLAPSMLGLWANASGSIAVLGVFQQTPPGMHEVLGWWIVPIAIGMAAAAFHLTRRLLAALKPLL
jgi:uncharacterized membrane protein